MKIIHLSIFLTAILFSSCHGKRLSTKNFMPIDNLSELNGRYINEENSLSKIFKVYNSEIDIVNLDFISKDSLIISYTDTVGYKKLVLKGKKKKNFFEIYYQNTRIYLPPIFIMNQIDRLRIGKDKDEKLLIYKWDEHYGMIMPLGAGGTSNDEYQTSFIRYNKDVKEGLYAVQINNKWGYANREDSIVIPPIYDYAQPFEGGRAKVARNNQWGIIDTTNNEITPLVYDIIMKPIDSIMQVRKNGKWGLLDFQNNEITPLVYDIIMKPKDRIMQVCKDGKWGLLDYQNNEITPLVYDIIMKPKDRIMQVCKDGKWGLLDYQNNEIAATKYDQILPFGSREYSDSLFSDLAEVHKDNKVGFINKQGKEVIPVEYDKIESHSYNWVGNSKYYRSQLGDKYGYISGEGVLCKPVFEEAGKRLYYNGFSPQNKTLVDTIGKYSEVIYKGEPYLFTEKGMLYKYKKRGFFKENRLEVDFDSGFNLNEQ